MFPGLSLSNDDDGLDPFKIMQVRNTLDNDYGQMIYHLDMRFQMAFTQMFEVVEFVKGALGRGRKVIVEHFDLLYPALGINADLLVGIGEEIIVTRPNLFGPLPKDIYDIVFTSLRNRKMAHTAEDLTTLVLKKDYKLSCRVQNSDVRGGFVLNFPHKPEIDTAELQNKVRALIAENMDVSYNDETHIRIGPHLIRCTGPRIHVRNTSDIINFRLLKEINYDHFIDMYALVGMVGNRNVDHQDLNKIMWEEEE